MSILHIITGLNVGGAEAMLAKLVTAGSDDPRLAPRLLSLLPPGPVGQRLAAGGVAVADLGMAQGRPRLADLVRLRTRVRAMAPRAVQGWMHHGNLAASLAAPPGIPVLWNIRHSLSDLGREPPMSRAVIRLCRLLSSRPAAIVYNSAVARRQYRAIGYDDRRATVIPNGFDCARYRPDPAARARLEQRLGVPPGRLVVAMVARYHPMKDQANLVRAMAALRRDGLMVHLLLAGAGFETLPAELAGLGLAPEDITCTGHRDDVADWLPGVAIVALASAWGEAFPNILGEAMACGVPCVATDVGDSAAIVGDTGLVVPPEDSAGLAAAIARLVALGSDERRALGLAARARVISHYALPAIARRYAELHAAAIAGDESLAVAA